MILIQPNAGDADLKQFNQTRLQYLKRKFELVISEDLIIISQDFQDVLMF
jgi:hypothetical protein